MIQVFKPWVTFTNSFDVFKAALKKEISGSSNYVKKFETEFSKQHNNMYSVAVSNGSVALDLVLNSLDLNEDDEIIMPSLTIISCLASISRTPAKPIFCDVDFNSWNMTLDNVKEKITKNTKAIVAVHTYGLPCDIEKIAEFCTKNSITLIEDTAEAHGIFVNDKVCGSFGDFATFSFYANKHITAGEGGIILSRDKDYYLKFLQMRNLDFTKINRFKTNNLYWNSRLGGLQAALGYSQIKNKTYEKIILKKKKQGYFYNELLSKYSDYFYLPLKQVNDVTNNYWVYGLVLKSPGLRDKLLELMMNDNIESRPFFWPLHQQPSYENNYDETFHLPNSEYLGKNGFYIPLGSHMSKKKQKYIVNRLIFNIKKLLENE